MEGNYPNSILTSSWLKIIWKSQKYQILITVPMLCELITEFKVDLAIRSKFQVFFLSVSFNLIFSTYELIRTNYESTNSVFIQYFYQYLLRSFLRCSKLRKNALIALLIKVFFGPMKNLFSFSTAKNWEIFVCKIGEKMICT